MSRSIVTLGAAALILSFAVSCTDSPSSPTVTALYSQTDIRVGTGNEAAVGGFLTVNYTGWLYDPTKTDQKGLMFDTSVGAVPFTFTLGAGQVIKGWDTGVLGMKAGGLRRLVIPPSLAYGNQRAGAIPPNSTLVFDIELISIS